MRVHKAILGLTVYKFATNLFKNCFIAKELHINMCANSPINHLFFNKPSSQNIFFAFIHIYSLVPDHVTNVLEVTSRTVGTWYKLF